MSKTSLTPTSYQGNEGQINSDQDAHIDGEEQIFESSDYGNFKNNFQDMVFS